MTPLLLTVAILLGLWALLHLVLHRPAATAVVAHRGAGGEAPENTLAAVRAGMESGAGFLEIDVRRSADGAFVVIHDATVERTTDGAGAVESMTTSQLRALDAGSWFDPAFAGERIPLLDEVLTAVGEWQGALAVEVKDPRMDLDIAEQLAIALQTGPFHRILLVSFDHDWLRLFRQVMPATPVGELSVYPLKPPDGAIVERIGVFWLATVIDPTLVWRSHRRGLQVWVWTIDHPIGIRLMRWLGVDGVTTNHPTRAAHLLREGELVLG
ncbi:MAG: glycerophosphodiester phosphodiesterase family protein [Anaerolineales bacterium]